MKKDRIAIFATCNAILFAVFSILWVIEYRLPDGLTDKIDRVFWPWLCACCFFIVSFFTLRGEMLKSAVISLFSTVIFMFTLMLFIAVLARLFDPHW
jgi:hypothetical protein